MLKVPLRSLYLQDLITNTPNHYCFKVFAKQANHQIVGAGGIVARYVIYLLSKQSILKSSTDSTKNDDRLECGHYISIACPHLGIQNNHSENPILTIFGINELLEKFMPQDQLAKDLMLLPRKGESEPLLLQVH